MTRPLDRRDLLALLDPEEAEKSVVITDPNLPDNPMVYVSETFERHTGYRSADVVGSNCRLLQGAGTDPDAVRAIRYALRAETTFVIDILNYRKNGDPFLNRLRLRPIFDGNGALWYFAGVQNPL